MATLRSILGPHASIVISSGNSALDTQRREPRSPIGPHLAAAASDGAVDALSRPPTPYHGYVYRILTQQGKTASGEARDYVVQEHMIGGFAVLASPAYYGISGIMSFLVNQEGVG